MKTEDAPLIHWLAHAPPIGLGTPRSEAPGTYSCHPPVIPASNAWVLYTLHARSLSPVLEGTPPRLLREAQKLPDVIDPTFIDNHNVVLTLSNGTCPFSDSHSLSAARAHPPTRKIYVNMPPTRLAPTRNTGTRKQKRTHSVIPGLVHNRLSSTPMSPPHLRTALCSSRF